MSIGFTLLDGSTAIPDKNHTVSSSHKVLTAKFGDGYEQRIADGINSLKEEYSLSFNTRTKEEIDNIRLFLNDKKGVGSFPYTYLDSNLSGGEVTVQVVCENFNTVHNYENYFSLTAKFRRVYEA